jgi:hypothetical protein
MQWAGREADVDVKWLPAAAAAAAAAAASAAAAAACAAAAAASNSANCDAFRTQARADAIQHAT